VSHRIVFAAILVIISGIALAFVSCSMPAAIREYRWSRDNGTEDEKALGRSVLGGRIAGGIASTAFLVLAVRVIVSLETVHWLSMVAVYAGLIASSWRAWTEVQYLRSYHRARARWHRPSVTAGGSGPRLKAV